MRLNFTTPVTIKSDNLQATDVLNNFKNIQFEIFSMYKGDLGYELCDIRTTSNQKHVREIIVLGIQSGLLLPIQ